MVTFKVPGRLAAVLGVIAGALSAASTQLHGLSPEAHIAIAFVLTLLAALGIHPTDTASSSEEIRVPSSVTSTQQQI
jgi:hypothetical protein